MCSGGSRNGYRLAMALAGFLLLISPVLRAQEAPDPANPTPEPDPPPTIFPHPETDRLWISGQANFISQWHRRFIPHIKARTASRLRPRMPLRACSPYSPACD